MMVLVSVETTVGVSLLAFLAGLVIRPIAWWKRRQDVRDRLFKLCK